MNIVGGVREKKDGKESSTPKEEPTLEILVKAKITHRLLFKQGSKTLEIAKISSMSIYPPIKGDFRTDIGKKYNYSFNGNAQIDIKFSNEFRTFRRNISGYFNKTENNEIDIYPVIQVSE